MIRRRIIVLLLTVLIITNIMLTSIVVADYSEPPLVTVSLTMYSNLSDKDSITGLYRNNRFYISLNDLVDITDVEVLEVNSEAITLIANGFRHLTIFSGIRNADYMRENFPNGGSHYVWMPSVVVGEDIYISSRNFLRYIGAYFSFNEHSEIQFMVAVRYNIFDVLFDSMTYNHFFCWLELGYSGRNIENQIVRSGFIAFFARDTNVLRWAIDPRTIERRFIEDALVAILTNEGERYFDDGNKPSDFFKLLSDVSTIQTDVIKFITSAYTSDVTADFARQLNDLAESASIVIGFTSDAVSAIETMRQFARITETQRSLLENTILRYGQYSTLMRDRENVMLAALNVNERVQSEYANTYHMMMELTDSLVNSTVSIGMINPVSKALTYVSLISRGLGLTDEHVQVYNAYNASVIQNIAHELFQDAWRMFERADFFYWSTIDQFVYLNRLRYSLILQLKSTLTIREYLATSGRLGIAQSIEMLETNVQIAEFLNRVTNAQMGFVGSIVEFREEYAEDISWISNFEIELRNVYYEAIEAYMKFLRQQGFQYYTSYAPLGHLWEHPVTGYAILHIDNDIPTLIINSGDSFGWHTSWFFIYDVSERIVVFEGSIYYWGVLRYSMQHRALVHIPVRNDAFSQLSHFSTLNCIRHDGAYFAVSAQWDYPYTRFDGLSSATLTVFYDIYDWDWERAISLTVDEFQNYFVDLVEIEFSPMPDNATASTLEGSRIDLLDLWNMGFENVLDLMGVPYDVEIFPPVAIHCAYSLTEISRYAFNDGLSIFTVTGQERKYMRDITIDYGEAENKQQFHFNGIDGTSTRDDVLALFGIPLFYWWYEGYRWEFYDAEQFFHGAFATAFNFRYDENSMVTLISIGLTT